MFSFSSCSTFFCGFPKKKRRKNGEKLLILLKERNGKKNSTNHYSICYSHKLSMFKSLIELAYNMSSAFNS